MPHDAREAALVLIEKIVALDAPYRAINDALREQQGDFAAHHSPIDQCIYDQVVALIDAALGEHEIGSYFLHECQRFSGAVHEADGTVWPINTVADLRAYVSRNDA